MVFDFVYARTTSPMAAVFVIALLLAAPASQGGSLGGDPVAALGAGVRAARAGRHAEAIRALRRAAAGGVKNRDYASFFMAQALAGQGDVGNAVKEYERVAKDRSSRFAGSAAWRAADVQWEAGRKAPAVARYKKLLEAKTPGGDRALAWMRIGQHALALGQKPTATAAFETVMVDFASHPAAAQAEALLSELDPAPDGESAGPVLSPALRIQRAQRLSDKRRWHAAIEELERMTDVPAELQALRDFVLGQAKYRSRKDYAQAAALLARAAPRLSGKQAAWAAFHSARALSRADRDDEAIIGYLAFVKAYPSSEFAAEAQFLAGWLDFNQGRFAKSVPALSETLRSFSRTPFAADASWYLTLGHYFTGDLPQALTQLADYERRTRSGSKSRIWPQDRVNYWRARILERMGRAQEARTLFAALVGEQPLRWYGLLATLRLRSAKVPDPIALPAGRAPLLPLDAKAKRDVTLQKVDELLVAGLKEDAGFETESAADGWIKRLGRERGLAAVIERSAAAGVYAKAYRLADVLGASALAARPEGDVRTVWRAVYPLAYEDLVQTYGPPAGNPEHYLYTIMHKESGFDPNVVSYADARGLLQMIPPTSRKVAQELGLAFSDEDLMRPSVNIQLGAAYIGSLYKKFAKQIPMAAGAYNAGPRAMMRWLDRHGTHPLDEFVELVSYEQTREYIKRVTGIYARYRYLYANERYLPDPNVDATYRADGPNY